MIRENGRLFVRGVIMSEYGTFKRKEPETQVPQSKEEKSIIEKLGIKRFSIKDIELSEEEKNSSIDYRLIKMEGLIRKAYYEQNELLKALIDVLEMYEGDGFPDASFLYDPLFKKIGTSWSEIKEIIK